MEPKWNREHDKIPSRIVMRYPESSSPGANVNGIVDNNSLLTSGRTETAPANIGSKASSGNGIEFVTDKPVPVLPKKRGRVLRNTNYMDIGSVHSAADDVDDRDPDDVEPAAAAESDQEATPESYNDAASAGCSQ